eukprot:scaffold15978_cov103-Isochrysis_galbana.AAC.7
MSPKRTPQSPRHHSPGRSRSAAPRQPCDASAAAPPCACGGMRARVSQTSPAKPALAQQTGCRWRRP